MGVDGSCAHATVVTRLRCSGPRAIFPTLIKLRNFEQGSESGSRIEILLRSGVDQSCGQVKVTQIAAPPGEEFDWLPTHVKRCPQGHFLSYTRRCTSIQTKLELRRVALQTHPGKRGLLRGSFHVDRDSSRGEKDGVTLKSFCSWGLIIVAPRQRL